MFCVWLSTTACIWHIVIHTCMHLYGWRIQMCTLYVGMHVGTLWHAYLAKCICSWVSVLSDTLSWLRVAMWLTPITRAVNKGWCIMLHATLCMQGVQTFSLPVLCYCCLYMFKQPLYMGNRSLYCLAAPAAIASPLSGGSLIQFGELYRAFFNCFMHMVSDVLKAGVNGEMRRWGLALILLWKLWMNIVPSVLFTSWISTI